MFLGMNGLLDIFVIGEKNTQFIVLIRKFIFRFKTKDEETTFDYFINFYY